MFTISIFGAGYVGLVTGACFAELGNHIVCFDTDASRIAMLVRGEMPIFEPGLAELVARNVEAGRLQFTDDAGFAVRTSQLLFIAVGTPMGNDGHADLQFVTSAAITIGQCLNGAKIVVNKSTVPVETGDLVSRLIKEHASDKFEVDVVSNPEFVREGSAIADFMGPDRVVLGVSRTNAGETMRALYAPLDVPVILTSVRTAEMIKYTANAFLATKISFINEIARICEQVGADVRDVVRGAGSDHRIGTAFLQPGLGFGGSCFPKDVLALARIAQSRGLEPKMLNATLETNAAALNGAFQKISDFFSNRLEGRLVGFLGLAFKPNTDDIRESPALELAIRLAAAGVRVRAHDPIAMDKCCRRTNTIEYVDEYEDVALGAEALVIATDWNAYKALPLERFKREMAGRVIFDFRNILDIDEAIRNGFSVVGIGRSSGPGTTAVVGPVTTAQ